MNPLDQVADWVPDQPPETAGGLSTVPRASGAFDVDAFINRHQLKVRRHGGWKGGEKWELEFCPINPEHTGGCAVITKAPNGALGFKCQHNSCAGISGLICARDWSRAIENRITAPAEANSLGLTHGRLSFHSPRCQSGEYRRTCSRVPLATWRGPLRRLPRRQLRWRS
jgi:hypothetical protein